MMSEWHITPDYITDNWTDELLALMTQKLAERKAYMASGRKQITSANMVSDKELFAQASRIIKVVKANGRN